jgi:hypothetical protein
MAKKIIKKIVTENESEEYNMSLDTAIDQKDDVKKLTDVNPDAEINIVQTEGEEDDTKDKDKAEIDQLSGGDTAENSVEYGMQYEGFDDVMKELEDKDKHVVNIKEDVKPRIKKKDLINYIKNKK